MTKHCTPQMPGQAPFGTGYFLRDGVSQACAPTFDVTPLTGRRALRSTKRAFSTLPPST